MPVAVNRKTVLDFYAARDSHDPGRIASFIANEVDWLMIGPVELMHFCGPRRSRDEVFEVFATHIPESLRVTGYTPEYLLIDADRAASLNRLTATQPATGRTISYRVADFMRFRDDKIIEYRALIDTLDAVEQMLGHQIDLSAE
jgi:ketosteroid isomerase-like protein